MRPSPTRSPRSSKTSPAGSDCRARRRRRLRELLKRCLRKDAKRRLRDIGDARVELEEPSSVRDEMPKTTWAPAPWVLVGLLAVLSAWLLFPRSAPPPPLTRFVLQLPEGARFSSGPQRQIDISGTNHRLPLLGQETTRRCTCKSSMSSHPSPSRIRKEPWDRSSRQTERGSASLPKAAFKKVAVTGGTPVSDMRCSTESRPQAGERTARSFSPERVQLGPAQRFGPTGVNLERSRLPDREAG